MKKCVVFVHGWNVDYNSAISFSETLFKRLWWQGYKGRYCSFRWPTLTGASSYNTSEYRGWKYGPALTQYVASLPSDYRKNVAAHSMGNIVTGSALLSGMAIENYALMQAAVPAGCYDESGDQTTGGINGYARFWSVEANKPTPDFADPDLGYRGTLKGVSGNLVNFHNSLDFALATGRTYGLETNWEANQQDYKPDSLAFPFRYYVYEPSAAVQQRGRLTDGGNPPSIIRYITQHHEMMAFVARPRSKAVGADGATRGSVGSDVDLRDEEYGFTSADYDHSGQFNRRIQVLSDFYRTLGTRLGLLEAQ
ncbi:MAG: alpha/beta hydrolase [Pseudomonadota bacterium]|nr:alpha/beta hydrolase [Pseudomonadota bacterium]